MSEPSLRYVIISVHGETRSNRTEYILGGNSRSEYRDCQTFRVGEPNRPGSARMEYGPSRAVIENRDLRCQFHLDLESRVYTVFELSEYRRPERFKPEARTPQRSGRTVHVRTETIDTGE